VVIELLAAAIKVELGEDEINAEMNWLDIDEPASDEKIEEAGLGAAALELDGSIDEE
jgi:hypothetical protein